MKSRLLGILGVAALMGIAPLGGAQAALFDFAGMAAGNEGAFTSATEDGITVDGFSTTGGTAYLDDVSGGPAGLGVCTVFTGGGTIGVCDPASDDNVTAGEVLVLTFDQVVVLGDTLFRTATHTTTFGPGALIDITVDGFLFDDISLVHMIDLFFLGTGTVFEFELDGVFGEQFYIQTLTAVPLPAAAPLFAAGLLVLGFAGRRRRKLQQVAA